MAKTGCDQRTWHRHYAMSSRTAGLSISALCSEWFDRTLLMEASTEYSGHLRSELNVLKVAENQFRKPKVRLLKWKPRSQVPKHGGEIIGRGSALRNGLCPYGGIPIDPGVRGVSIGNPPTLA